MRKLLLALAVAFCSSQSWSQSDCGELLDHNQDGIIGAEDLMNLLSFYGQPLTASEGPCDNLESVTFDGYDYDLVAIGDQCWFAENLRTEHYANGDSIPSNLATGEWQSTTNGAVSVYGENGTCWSNSPDGDACDPAWSLNEYGRLYNYYAVDDERGLCPTGWHVATDEEWTVMTDHLGGASVAGDAIKNLNGWFNGGGNATNSSGFSGLPGGVRNTTCCYGSYEFSNAGSTGGWWSSTDGFQFPWMRAISDGSSMVMRGNVLVTEGYSVRCLKDTTP